MKRRISHYQSITEIGYAIAKKLLPMYRHKNSPHRFTWPQLAACVLMAFYLDCSYRDMEDWLLVSDKICHSLELQEVPDHSTLCRAFHRLDIRLLRGMQRLLLQKASIQEVAIGIDSTGFRTDQASAYYSFRNGRPKKDWVKGAYAVGVSSQLILGARSSYGRYQDAVLLNSLRRQSQPYASRNHVILADAGFDGRQVKPGDIIPPVRRHGTIRAPERIARAELVGQARLDGLYGQRWKCETVHSVIKRKFGDTVRSRTTQLHFREAFVKGLIYNLHVF
jgi:IS5 family transposase